MLPSETMIWQPEFTDKILSRKPGAVQFFFSCLFQQAFNMITQMLHFQATQQDFQPCITTAPHRHSVVDILPD
ncbi:hypothetical protein F9L27_24170 [Escherichia coli]|nr:hypothetical protein [Escherichia coli]EFE7189300.1 hypothetical protein [Escherichia coli]EFE7341033.1 hypothetical protein [Escherichia coli]EFF5233013.1 hypothetical protein [Escherichia coli]